MSYGAADNARKSYDVAIAALRERFVQATSGRSQMTPTLDSIITATADVCALTTDDIIGRRRHRDAVLARHYAMALAVKLGGMTSSQAGRAFGRDHTTISAAVARINELTNTHVVHRARVDAIIRKAKGENDNTEEAKERICYTVADRNDIAMVRAKADPAERALIALLRLDYANREIDLPRAPRVADEVHELA